MMELAALGESMVMVAPEANARLGRSPSYVLHVGGAESNVAMYIAAMGHRAKWLSRVGTGPLGDFVTDQIAASGVDTSGVARDDERPTGIYFKDPGELSTKVWYYRSGSAATAMDRSMVPALRADLPRLLHLSGITAALSESCLDLMRHLVHDRPLLGTTISFDVNYRSALDTDGELAATLFELASEADIVFVGLDEAGIWDCSDVNEVRSLFPEVPEIVVKDSGRAATGFGAGEPVAVPAPVVDVVEAVGAGDAFAAGWLSGWLRDLTPRERLRIGHRLASAALRSNADVAELPSPDVILDELDIYRPAWDSHDNERVKG